MDINALIMDLLRQAVQEGKTVEGSQEIDLDSIDPAHSVLIQMGFHVDVTVEGERVPHSDGIRVEIFESIIIAEDDISPEQFPGDFRPKGVG